MRSSTKLVSMLISAALAVSAFAADNPATEKTAKKKASAATKKAAPSSEMKELRDTLAAQQKAMEEQSRAIQALQQELQRRDAATQQQMEALRQAQAASAEAASKAAAAENAVGQTTESLTKLQTDVADVKLNQQNAAISTQEDQKRLVAAEGLLNRFRFSGDVRVRGESFFQDYSGCTACLDRYRARIRARLGIDGKINEDFTGGIYLATGAVTNGSPTFFDPVSTNETLTSYFERKTIGLDRAWVTYQPQAHKWLQLTGGKFAYNWQRTTLTFDPDLNPEGFSEKISYDVKNQFLKNVTVQGLQFFFNEVSAGPDSNAVGGQFLTKWQLGKRVTFTPSFTALNWNGADAIAQAAFPVTLPQPNDPGPGLPLPQPTTQPVRIINANAFTNASQIVGAGTGQKRAFVSGFLYTDYIADTNVITPWAKYPFRFLAEYEQNLRAVPSAVTGTNQDKAYWVEGSLGKQTDRNDLLFGYSFARIDQDAVISQFNESDTRAATNVIQHRWYVNWLVQRNTTAAFTMWVGRTLNPNLQNAAKAPGLPAGMQDPFLKRLQLDIVYKF